MVSPPGLTSINLLSHFLVLSELLEMSLSNYIIFYTILLL